MPPEYPPFSEKNSMPDFFWSTEGFPKKFFPNVRQQNLDVKSWYSLPSPIVREKLLDTRSVLEIERFPYENFLPWDKNESSKSSYPPCFPKVFQNWKVFWNIEKCPNKKNIATVRQQSFDVNSWYSLPSPLVLEKLLDTRSVLENERLLYENFLQWDKNETSKSCYLPCFPKVFQNWKKIWNTEMCPNRKNIATVRQQSFDVNSWYSLPPRIDKCFWYQEYSGKSVGSLRNVLASWVKK